jgi:LuxR family quorum-sensing system transcriptional regulator SolR
MTANLSDIPLTSKELQALAWTAAGKTAVQTGELMFLSARTVNFHISSAISKLGAANKTAAAVIAVRAGWI